MVLCINFLNSVFISLCKFLFNNDMSFIGKLCIPKENYSFERVSISVEPWKSSSR